jgi:hypothetical protein
MQDDGSCSPLSSRVHRPSPACQLPDHPYITMFPVAHTTCQCHPDHVAASTAPSHQHCLNAHHLNTAASTLPPQPCHLTLPPQPCHLNPATSNPPPQTYRLKPAASTSPPQPRCFKPAASALTCCFNTHSLEDTMFHFQLYGAFPKVISYTV